MKSIFAPDDFEVSDEMREWARSKNLNVDIDYQTDLFINHEFRRPYTDWVRCWRNWLLRAGKYDKPIQHQTSRAPEFIRALAKQKQIEPRPGESMDEFTRRVQQTR